jgi:transcriptional regulator with XRE-family HTH domain
MTMKNRIRELREAKGLSQSALADLMGIHWQSVQRAETGKTALTSAKVEAYAMALVVEPEEILVNPDVRTVLVKGEVQAGAWSEALEWEADEQYFVPVPKDPRLDAFHLWGVVAKGPSMNRRYPDGTVLVLASLAETGEALMVGKRYVVERERSDGLREATVKKLWRDDDGKMWLLPESDDPRHQEPIPVDGGEDDTIRIIGRVRYAISRE